MYYILLFIFEQLMEIVSGLNWGSLATKVEKLIDTKIESRFDDSGEETNCFSKFFIAMHSTLFYVFSVIIFIINLIFCILIVNNILEWMKNNLIETCWCWDLAIMLLYLILFYPKKRNCKENNENQKDRIKVVALIIAFIFCLVEIYTCTLSFYAIYYSFKGKTYFYYFCFDTEEACECLFSLYENNNCYIDDVKDRNINTAYYYYYKIFLNNGSSGIFIFSIIMRIIMFIWNLAFIVNILLFPQLFSNLQKFKRIINFVRNEDGTITDLDDISIKEIHEGFKGGNKADSKENLGEKKVIKLQKVIRKKITANNNYVSNTNAVNNIPIIETNQNIPFNNQNNICNNIINNNKNNRSVKIQNNIQNNNNNLPLNIINNNSYNNQRINNNELLYFNFGTTSGRNINGYY